MSDQASTVQVFVDETHLIGTSNKPKLLHRQTTGTLTLSHLKIGVSPTATSKLTEHSWPPDYVYPAPSELCHSSPKSVVFHLHTVWLFTRNDLKSIVLPETLFGIFSALSGSALTTNENPSLYSILSRIPLLLLWTWLNVFVFDVANQRLESSVVEDAINKPWRPLPSRRLSAQGARWLLLLLIPCVCATTWVIGGLRETVAMLVLTWMYNDLAGADEHWLLRNLINAAGFVCYSAGTTRVAAGTDIYDLNDTASYWLAIVGGVVFTTLQMQDMPDMAGDRARGRRTLPLDVGEEVGRWSIALPVLCWSVICPAFWSLVWTGYAVSLIPGAVLAWRVLSYRNVEADKKTWKLWCWWTTVLYLLPVLQKSW